MGNFSRDPDAFAEQSIKQHYVGVRLQQAVPLLDADFNLANDMRQRELEDFARLFIGSGVPSGTDGFEIEATNTENDFAIGPGVCLVEGKWVRTPLASTYGTQPNKMPAFAAPAVGAPQNQLAVLEVWDREVDSDEDHSLIDEHIGIETSVRLRREWAVIIWIEGAPNYRKPGHCYLPLARLRRQPGVETITGADVDDLRETGLSVLRQVMVDTPNGIVDNPTLERTLRNTRDALQGFARYLCMNFNAPGSPLPAVEVLVMQAAQHVAATVEAGLAQLATTSMSNQGALRYLRQLHAAHLHFLDTWKSDVLAPGTGWKKYESYQTSVDRLAKLLGNGTVEPYVGLGVALKDGDLFEANRTLGAIASWISRAGSKITRGSVALTYFGVNEVLTSGSTKLLAFEATGVTSQKDTYSVRTKQSAWPMAIVDESGTPFANSEIPVGAYGDPSTVFYVAVTVGSTKTDLQVTIEAETNPEEVRAVSSAIELVAGQKPPPGERRIKLVPESGNNLRPISSTGVAIMENGTQQATAGMEVHNFTGAEADFKVTVSQVAGSVGTWTVAVIGDGNTTGVANGAKRNLSQFTIKPGDGASSVQVLYTVNAKFTDGSGTASRSYIFQIQTPTP